MKKSLMARACVLAITLATTGGLAGSAAPAGAAPAGWTSNTTATGSIAGTVSDPTGAPLAGVYVTAINVFYGNIGGSTVTAEDGTYEITGVKPTSYHVRFSDPTNTFATIYNGASTTFQAAPRVSVVSDNTSTEDASMPLPATIEGSVSSGPLADQGIVVVVLDTLVLEAVAVTQTAADGTYRVEVAPGDYKLAFIDLGIAATPAVGLRPVLGGIDALDAGFAVSYYWGERVTAGSGAASTVDVSLVGMDCFPAIAANGFLNDMDMSNANLKGCDLHGMTFTNVNLAGADLSGANLSGATLENVDLTATNLEMADMSGAVLVDSDTSQTVGTPAE